MPLLIALFFYLLDLEFPFLRFVTVILVGVSFLFELNSLKESLILVTVLNI